MIIATRVSLNPDAQKFVEEKIRSGRYATPEELVSDAIARLRQDDEQAIDTSFTPADLADINEAEAEVARGEVLDWKTVEAQLRKDYLGT